MSIRWQRVSAVAFLSGIIFILCLYDYFFSEQPFFWQMFATLLFLFLVGLSVHEVSYNWNDK